jgi:hypothetical protein
MNGKGDKWRKGVNFKVYGENYDRIFRKKETPSLTNEELNELEVNKDTLSHSEFLKIRARKGS